MGEARGLETRAELQLELKGHLLDNSLLVQGAQSLFYPGLQLIGQGPPHKGGHLHYSRSIDLNVNFTHKQLHRNTKNV